MAIFFFVISFLRRRVVTKELGNNCYFSLGGTQPAILQEVIIPIWSNQDCMMKYGPAAPGGIVDHMLCAGRASRDSCSVSLTAKTSTLKIFCKTPNLKK